MISEQSVLQWYTFWFVCFILCLAFVLQTCKVIKGQMKVKCGSRKWTVKENNNIKLNPSKRFDLCPLITFCEFKYSKKNSLILFFFRFGIFREKQQPTQWMHHFLFIRVNSVETYRFLKIKLFCFVYNWPINCFV